VWLRVLIERHGAVPVMATVASHVLVAADLVGLDLQGPELQARTRLVLREPGVWSAAFGGRRLVTPPGNSWLLWKGDRACREARPASTHWYL
jgi:hypothetical protein